MTKSKMYSPGSLGRAVLVLCRIVLVPSRVASCSTRVVPCSTRVVSCCVVFSRVVSRSVF